ncbi:DNA-binding protein [Corynebacterium diphtheriae]|uniref:helicase-associated domain-containing protein n=1 Tax=Corynebacterium diphtheriae TaxID=1717 RepID=UPI000F1F8A46|nr:helicase-associated domain-containing protein [Corynebacterium diphtheriae]MBG9303118.1 helicase-associated domain-containing protein [Corynebacterium diphtheriae bv. mitis]MBG9305363.1 helicase-associated domain-containing protein [Corynebacterium diphtheriae bv. mitis]RKX05921.1 DNA-binding protein [Corynebacterium diphtheriae]CAB0544749.1 DNA-binding protein [Corynebacterium diphtheriae]
MTSSNDSTSTTAIFRQWLHNLDEDALRRVLEHRPDTTHPLPPGINSLAARLSLRASIMRALVRLNARELAVLEAASIAGAEIEPVDAPKLVELVRSYSEQNTHDTNRWAPSESELLATIDTLRDYALLFGELAALRIAPDVMDALPAGWQLLPSAHVPNATELPEILEGLTTKQRSILHTLAQSGGTGITKDAAIDADPSRPIPQLIALGLVTRHNSHTVTLPMSVRFALSGKPAPVLPLCPVAVSQEISSESRVEEQSTAAGLEAVRLTRVLIDVLSDSPIALLKDNAVGVRPVATLSRALDVEETTLYRVIAAAMGAGLIARGVPDPLPTNDTGGDYLAPTGRADEWNAQPLSVQWAWLMLGWWEHATLNVAAIGQPDEKNKPHRLLSAATISDKLPSTRMLVLQSAASHVFPHGGDKGVLLANFGFDSPIRASRLARDVFDDITDSAQFLGILGPRWEPTTVLRLLAHNDHHEDLLGRLCEATASLTPAESDRLIPQGDMTILAPAPLPFEAHTMMALMSDTESMGLATVFRLNSTSVRRALDAGKTDSDLVGFLKDHTIGDLPQSLVYLISDTARRHGALRGGPALSYVRCDDPALLLEVSRIEAAADLGFRIIAPTVLIAQAPLAQVLETIRSAGFAPAAENAQGLSIDIRPHPTRVATPTVRPTMPHEDPAHIRQALLTLLRDRDASRGETHGIEGSDAVSVLHSAMRANHKVHVGIVDKQGQALRYTVTPVTITGGHVSAVDADSGEVIHFMLHRITEVALDSGA